MFTFNSFKKQKYEFYNNYIIFYIKNINFIILLNRAEIILFSG